MAKLKLGAIADDKPVKLTVELPADVHRDLAAYTDTACPRNRAVDLGSGKAGRTNAGAIHGNRPSLCKDPPQGSACARQGIALAQQFEKVCQRRIVIVLAPMC